MVGKFASSNWLGARGGEEMTTNCTYFHMTKMSRVDNEVEKPSSHKYNNTHTHTQVIQVQGFYVYPPGIITLLYAKCQNGARGENDVLGAGISLLGLGSVSFLVRNSKWCFFLLPLNPVL